MNTERKIWGNNKYGQTIREHDKLKCGKGLDTWFTHVHIDEETGEWHREYDYYSGIRMGEYETDTPAL